MGFENLPHVGTLTRSSISRGKVCKSSVSPTAWDPDKPTSFTPLTDTKGSELVLKLVNQNSSMKRKNCSLKEYIVGIQKTHSLRALYLPARENKWGDTSRAGGKPYEFRAGGPGQKWQRDTGLLLMHSLQESKSFPRAQVCWGVSAVPLCARRGRGNRKSPGDD